MTDFLMSHDYSILMRFLTYNEERNILQLILFPSHT